ncbi:hypothetical protein NPIL_13921 [Nephila pilipes]|uniref:Uncharacterized protein n=1 Tax=Nephila pilipes TaxID=299642 RepID=A0A8X6M5T7_NEPPI|nr:hypothetical protein NPIL_13921 [Nephila pilipes]
MPILNPEVSQEEGWRSPYYFLPRPGRQEPAFNPQMRSRPALCCKYGVKAQFWLKRSHISGSHGIESTLCGVGLEVDLTRVLDISQTLNSPKIHSCLQARQQNNP